MVTPEPNRSVSHGAKDSKAVVAGSLAHFGTYVVGEDKSFTFQIERATFPNWEGKNNKRSFVIAGDELRFKDPHAPGRQGGSDHLPAREVISFFTALKHEILQEQDRYRLQFWAAFDAFVPGTPLFG